MSVIESLLAVALAGARIKLRIGDVTAEAFPFPWAVASMLREPSRRYASWNGDELCEARQQFSAGFGSCSFDEPMHDLEALGWL